MKIENLMTKNIIVGDIEDSISSIAILMARNDIGFIPISKEKKIVGVITDRDIVIKAIKGNYNLSENISKFITKKVLSVNINDDLGEAVNLMKEKKVKRLIVERDGNVVGILSLSDILKSELDPLIIVGAVKEIFHINKNKKENYQL